MDADYLRDVADLCRHLLGDDLHLLSLVRDGHLGTRPPADGDDQQLIAWLDELQLAWVRGSGGPVERQPSGREQPGSTSPLS